jgi:hypothetical protein
LIVEQLPQHVASQNTLNVVDVQMLVEPLLDRHGTARDPDFQFRIEVEVSSGLDAKMGDVPVRQRVVLDLISRKALRVKTRAI